MLSTVPKMRMADAPPPTDDQLLKRFVEGRDEDAFAVLVRRHGAMVLGVCRRVAGHTHDAEDAFQATFLVLARRAAAVSPAMLAAWLYGVAYRTALKTRTAAGRRRGKEHSMAAVPETSQEPKEVDRELIQQLDSALSRLPTKYRVAIVLCELEQQPRRQAAARLQIPEGTLSSRLAAGRKMLAASLTKRGVTLSVGALGVSLSILTRAVPADPLVVSTVQAAASFCAGGVVHLATASSGAVTLAQGVLRMMIIKNVAVGVLVLLTGTSLVGVGAAVYGGRASDGDDASIGRVVEQRKDGRATAKSAAANANIAAKQGEAKSAAAATVEKKTDNNKNRKKDAQPDPRQVVQKALEGVWLLESLEDHAKAADPKEFHVVFNKDQFTFKVPTGPEQDFSGRYEIDPDKGPQIIDFIAERDGKPRLAIFDLKGDELRICMNEDPDGERPDRFVSEKRGKNDLLMILKRQKAAKETK
ncbi:MAG: sigma-70 family RNA polymerase sigma factor [Pirellulales bacterium]